MSRHSISYFPGSNSDGKPKRQSGTYYLATTGDLVQFYCFDEPKDDSVGKWKLIDRLDRGQLLGAGDKATAKTWAQRLGLKSWTYVRI